MLDYPSLLIRILEHILSLTCLLCHMNIPVNEESPETLRIRFDLASSETLRLDFGGLH